VTPHDDDEARAGTPAEGDGEGDDVTLSSVSVTVDEEHLDDMSGVVEALRERGMQVDAVLESLGMVTGSAPDTEALRQVEGVSAVDAVQERHVPPPEEEIQ
jgi:methylmalonyl-CoA mutase cobalamin-binding subunit